MYWKFTPTGYFFVKSTIWANNTITEPHPKANLLISLWNLNLQSKLQFFAWRLARNMFPTKGKLRKLVCL